MAGEIVLHEAFYGLLTLEKAAEAAGVHPELIERFVAFGLVEPACRREGILFFRPEAIPKLRAICRLRREMGLNLPGIALVLELREEIARLRGELERLRGG